MTRYDRDRDHLAARLSRAVDGLDDPAAPMVVVDLDAFDANLDDLVRRAGRTPIRVATKSIRVPALIGRALARPGTRGALAYQLREALWLADADAGLGLDDVVVGYPTTDTGALRRLTAQPELAARITLMIDDVAHLDLIDASRVDAVPIRVAIDVDAGLHVSRGGLHAHVGPKRSPLADANAVLALARTALDRGFVVDGVMTYEGQVAGVPDAVPGRRTRSFAVRRIKQASLGQLHERRQAVTAALGELTDLRFVNGGGTGSIETTVADSAVTEVAAGSGLFVPGLFDHYRSFTARPAAFFGVPVVRRPTPGIATVAGGGFVASGPAGRDRAPIPWAPAGLELTSLEGAGEVQTPLTGPGAAGLRIGDWVWFRHAKAGELAEHTALVRLVRGDRVVDEVPTYRGLGLSW